METTQDTKEESKEQAELKQEMKISGDDILKFFRRIFKEGNSRLVIFRKENGETLFKVNLVLLAVIYFFIPILALISILFLMATNYSLNIEKKSV